MALKLKISAEDFAKLPADVQKEYKTDGEGYALDVTGIEDAGALRRAHDRTKQELAETKTKLDTANDQLAVLSDGDKNRLKDISTLEAGWKKRLEDAQNTSNKQMSDLKAGLRDQAISAAADSMARKLSDSPALLVPHLRSRIVAEVDDAGKATIKYSGKDKDGKDVNLTADELQKEFAGNADYRAIIRVSQASGGGAGGAGARGNRGSDRTGNNPDKDANLATASASDLVARINAKKEANESGQ